MTTADSLSLAEAIESEKYTEFSTSLVLPHYEGITRALKVRKAPSLFNVITGPRGSMKTLLLTLLACRNLLKCFYLQYYGKYKHVWSNYPIGFRHQSVVDGKWYYLHSEPLNMESFYTFDAGLAAGSVYIDEIDQWYDRQDWAAITQKLTNAVITQIRKRELSLSATTQNFQWLNARAQFQTDTLINCREAAFTPWGRKMGLQMGRISFLTLKDLSGVNTGYQYAENFRTYSTRLAHGERYWDKYDTNFQFDPTETKKKFTLKRDSTTITLGEHGYEITARPDGSEGMSSQSNNPAVAIFSHIMDEFREQGLGYVPPSEIWSRAHEMGWNGALGSGGQILNRLGFARNKRNYIIKDNIEQDDLNGRGNGDGAPQPQKHIRRVKAEAE
jgi:hypothetical protein